MAFAASQSFKREYHFIYACLLKFWIFVKISLATIGSNGLSTRPWGKDWEWGKQNSEEVEGFLLHWLPFQTLARHLEESIDCEFNLFKKHENILLVLDFLFVYL